MKALVLRAHQLETKILEWLRSPALLLIRLVLGWQFFLTGKGKLANLERTTTFFASLGLPMPKLNAIMAGSTEMVGGLLLVIGLGGRVVTIPLIFTMLVAYATAHRDVFGNMLPKEGGLDFDPLISAAPFPFLLGCAVILLYGAGALSADHVLWKQIAPRDDSRK